MTTNPDKLYDLMPAIYRERDAEQGYPMRALLRTVGAQAALLDADIETLYNDLFIETCRDWVIPYIGDLVSNDLLFDASRIADPATARSLFPDLVGKDLRPAVAARVRADVAKTIYYRRRKGTLPMLEELARDVTGWPAHAVEFFELLGWTQFMEHRRFQAQWTDVRSPERTDRIGGAFDVAIHTVDVRTIAQNEGWYNIRNIGFYLWRLQSYPLEFVPARQSSAAWRYHFSPLGNPTPIFSRWRREGSETGLAREIDVPQPIRRLFFQQELETYRNTPPTRPDFTELYGLFEPLPPSTLATAPQASFFIVRNGVPVTLAVNPAAPLSLYEPQIVCRRLDPWPAAQPTGRIIAVDVVAGRMAIGDGWPDATDTLDVYYHYGFPADIGGGPYERRKWLIKPQLAGTEYRVKADGVAPPGTPPITHTSVLDALNDWASVDGRPNAILHILDSRTYELPPFLVLPNEGWLAIEAVDGQRPVLQTAAAGLELRVSPPIIANDPERDAAFTLSGVVVEGWVHVTGDLALLRLLHATLIPGRALDDDGLPAGADPSILAEPVLSGDPINRKLQVQLASSICGGIVVPEDAAGIWVLDGIVDGAGADAITGPPLLLERSTVIGPVNVKSLEASECIFVDKVHAERTQEGCVRFSYVPPGSRTPRRFRCQPDLVSEAAIAEALERNPLLTTAQQTAIGDKAAKRVVPVFTSRRYGRPEYCQLHLGCPVELRAGAEDGSEMGVYSQVKQAQRESNLDIRLREYLPFGLEAGVIYVT